MENGSTGLRKDSPNLKPRKEMVKFLYEEGYRRINGLVGQTKLEILGRTEKNIANYD